MLATDQYTKDLKEAYKASRQEGLNADEALEVFCTKQAAALEKYLKTLTVTYTTGLANGGGPVTGTFGHTIG